jgi:hypothetical protein
MANGMTMGGLQYKASFRRQEFDDFELDAMLHSRIRDVCQRSK